jgi:hypothetical protein
MSLLSPTLSQFREIPAEVKLRNEVNQIKASPRRMADDLIRNWERAFDLLWTEKDGITPAQRIEALGTDAAELFGANAALVQFLVTVFTGKDDALVAHILAKVGTIPEFTAHEDGTVTLN